ncbi:MAG TPA: hypothetical protein VGM91_17115 [Conexibacter sp.]|jgi:Flp pilus assembly protein TadB
MAQTKKKRQTKHRGNAAGQIESRGRTGRRPGEGERKGSARDQAQLRRQQKLDTPPTWRGSLNRAGLAAGFFFVLLLVLFRGQAIGAKVAIALFMLVVYIPLGYYTDLFIYRRRQARRAKERAAAKKGET